MSVVSFLTKRAAGAQSEAAEAPANALDNLLAERARISNELARFTILDDRLAATDTQAGEIARALADLDREEHDAMAHWADSGKGLPPTARLDARRALLARRNDAEAEQQAARVASAAVEAKRFALLAEMRSVNARIRETQIDTALTEAKAIRTEVDALAKQVGEAMMRLLAFQQAVVEAQAIEFSGGDADLAGSFQAAAQTAAELAKIPTAAMGDPATVARLTAEWRGRLR